MVVLDLGLSFSTFLQSLAPGGLPAEVGRCTDDVRDEGGFPHLTIDGYRDVTLCRQVDGSTVLGS